MNATIAPHVVRALLARLTADIHERLHHLDCFEPLLDGSIDHDGYVALLRRLHAFHAPLENALVVRAEVFARFGITIDAHRRVDRLRADLLSLGATADPPATVAEPFAPDDPGRCFGALYVREGAMLGGRVLARRLDRLLGDTDAGRRFLQGDPGDGARWTAVCDALDRVAAADHAAMAAMADGANRCFEAFARHMTRVPA